MMSASTPVPKTLSDPSVRRSRKKLLNGEHVAPLTDFVRVLREERGLGREIPFFDPLDGGTKALCLVVAEAPGPRAVRSGFVSRDNPDESAKNTLLAHHEAGLPREATVLWNIVPWYIGSGTRIRPAESADIEQGMPYLFRLLQRLPDLRVVVLAGRKAQRAEEYIRERHPHLKVFAAPHPSPLFVNRDPRNWSRLVHEVRRVAESLDSTEIDDPERRLAPGMNRTTKYDRTPEATRQAQRTDWLEGLGLDELMQIARERAVILPSAGPGDRDAILAAIRALPEAVRSTSRLAGKRIVRAKEYQAGGNPRRPGSHGFKAYELIPTGDYGILFEDLLARIRMLPAKSSESYGAGGTNHIKWDLDHGNTYLVDDASSLTRVSHSPAVRMREESEVWTRYRILDGLDISVREDVAAAQAETIEELLHSARTILRQA